MSDSLVVHEGMTADDLRSLVGDHLILVSYDGMSKFGILGEDFDGDVFPVRLLVGDRGYPKALTNRWERMDRHHFTVEGLYTEPVPELAVEQPAAHPSVDDAFTEAELIAIVRTGAQTVMVEHGDSRRGVLRGYRAGAEDEFGLFLIDAADGPVSLIRQAFKVVYVENTPTRHAGSYTDLGVVPVSGPVTGFIACMTDLLAVGMSDFMSNTPTFRMRMDCDLRSKDKDERRYRLLVRPVMSPIMHDEILLVCKIAERYNLAVLHTNAGLEIRTPDDVG